MTSKTVTLRGREALIVTCAFVSLTAPPAFGQDAEHHDEDEEVAVEDIIVQATRSRRRVQDEPIRVEVIPQEEIEEKLLMRPGNISMLLAETGGLRVQTTSPSLGGANVRVQGMRGRYTQLLSDGLPLFGGTASSLGLLQIPPSDLGRVEVIKGSASALYGGSALGGVINLVSRRPGDEAAGELILNATTRDGQDLSAYAATPLADGWSGSVLVTANRQSADDVDGDGWADLAAYERATLRPRLFWFGEDGSSLFLTAGLLDEDRRGGTLEGAVAPDGRPFPEDQETRRVDAGLVYERPFAEAGLWQVRAAAVDVDHRHVAGEVTDDDHHMNGLIESSVSFDAWGSTWLVGAAVQGETYRSEAFSAFDYDFATPGVFAQVERDLGQSITLAASARWDDHERYGNQFSPRVSMLARRGAFALRASAGQGWFAPTPFVEEIETAGLARLEPLSGLKAEIARTASLDLSWSEGPWEAGLVLFGSDIEDAVQVQTVGPQQVRLANIDGVTRTRGVETLLRWRQEPFVVTASHVYVDASEPDPDAPGRRRTPLTPRHSAGVVAVMEDHDRGRIGFEAYYTGAQSLDDDPYRDESDAYWELGMLGEVVLGRVRLFLNLENLLDVRQTDYDRLIRPTRAPDGAWTTDAWAPLEGFTANVGVRIRFGGSS